MYVGRIVAVGQTVSGRMAAMYRVSSRSFPNRQAQVGDGVVSIIPKPGYEDDIHRNPYIAYNCLRLVNGYAVATNGAQTDPITEKLDAGVPVRDALTQVLLALDYEHDSYNTPRIAAVVQSESETGFLGVVRRDAIVVRQFPLSPGQVLYVCTYEHDAPDETRGDQGFAAESAADCCSYVLGKGVFAEFERPVTAACALEDGSGRFEMAVADAAGE